MSTNTKSLGKYWLYFIVSLVAFVALRVNLPEWCWVVLPFLCTSFVQAMDWM